MLSSIHGLNAKSRDTSLVKKLNVPAKNLVTHWTLNSWDLEK